MTIKLLKKLFHKPMFEKVDDIVVNEIQIKDIAVMIEVYEQFEPYLKTRDFANLVTEKAKEILIFIFICTGIKPDDAAKLPASKLLPLFDKCLGVNHDFFTQTFMMKKLRQETITTEKKTYTPSKRLQGRIVSIDNGLLVPITDQKI